MTIECRCRRATIEVGPLDRIVRGLIVIRRVCLACGTSRHEVRL